jgi:hypothetical protein
MTSATRSGRYRAKEIRLTEAGFLFDPTNGESYTVNPTGRLIVRALIAGRAPNEIWRELCERFAVSESRARWDVEQFIARLLDLELLAFEPEPAPAAAPAGDDADAA